MVHRLQKKRPWLKHPRLHLRSSQKRLLRRLLLKPLLLKRRQKWPLLWKHPLLNKSAYCAFKNPV
jgi:hypothetical protein